ncbi:MAG: hypothetical protein CBE49_003515 [Rickettsiales bacterium TMED289]|nr:MAG: hypothetical protein CBE49_003515 [Rickettsiales bacterium TMED289]
MKLNYDSLPTLMLLATGLFVMFASPPVVNYEGVESAGKFMPFNGDENEANGKAYVLESDDYMDKALALAEAYSSLDQEKLLSLMTEDMKPFADNMDELESYSWKPWSMVPLRRVDDNGAFVVSWSYDTSEQKNGSKAATNYIDILRFDDADNGKLSGIWSTLRRDPENSEYGLPEGGKFVGRSEASSDWSGNPFVFSNRGEVEKMEAFLEAANNMDADTSLEFFTNPFTFNETELTHDDLRSIFEGRKTQEWKPWAMIPIKIKDTDPESGLIVWSEVRVESNEGEVWEAEVSETYYFDLDGKISGVTQFAKPLSSNDDSE